MQSSNASEHGAADGAASDEYQPLEHDGEPERALPAPPSPTREEADALPHDPADGDPGTGALGGDH